MKTPALAALASLLIFHSASAAVLKRAEVTAVINDVKILEPSAGERAAKVKDMVQGQTAVKTGIQSRSELLFQDRTLTRLGANTLFSFTEGTRDLELEHGTMLLQCPKGIGGAKIRTAAVTAAITGTTILLEYSPPPIPKRPPGYIPTIAEMTLGEVLAELQHPRRNYTKAEHSALETKAKPSKKGGSGGYVKVVVLEGTLRLFLNTRMGESVLVTAGQMIILDPHAATIPPAVHYDIARLAQTSLLVDNKFWGGVATDLSLALVAQEMAIQNKEIGRGQLLATNLVIPGSGTEVFTLAQLDQSIQAKGTTVVDYSPPNNGNPTGPSGSGGGGSGGGGSGGNSNTPPGSSGGIITSPDPYLVGSGSVISTDPSITTNGVTDIGSLYRSGPLDGPLSVYLYGSTSAFDQTVFENPQNDLNPNFPTGLATFMFSHLVLTGPPTFLTTGGSLDVALISEGAMTSSAPGGVFNLDSLDGLWLGTVNGSITLGPELSFTSTRTFVPTGVFGQGVGLLLDARGATSDVVFGSNVTFADRSLHLLAEHDVVVNSQITALSSTDPLSRSEFDFETKAGNDFILGPTGRITASYIQIEAQDVLGSGGALVDTVSLDLRIGNVANVTQSGGLLYVNTLPFSQTNLQNIGIQGNAGVTVSGNAVFNTAPDTYPGFTGLDLNSGSGDVVINGNLTTNNTLRIETNHNFILGPGGLVTANNVEIYSILGGITLPGDVMFNTPPNPNNNTSFVGVQINGDGESSGTNGIIPGAAGDVTINGQLTTNNSLQIYTSGNFIMGPGALITAHDVSISSNLGGITLPGNVTFNTAPNPGGNTSFVGVQINGDGQNTGPTGNIPGPAGDVTINGQLTTNNDLQINTSGNFIMGPGALITAHNVQISSNLGGITLPGDVTFNTAPNPGGNTQFVGLTIDGNGGNNDNIAGDVTINGHLTTNNALSFETDHYFIMGPGALITAQSVDMYSRNAPLTLPGDVTLNMPVTLEADTSDVVVNGHLTSTNSLQIYTGLNFAPVGNFVLGPNGRITAPNINISQVLDVVGSGNAVIDGASAKIGIQIQNQATVTQSGNLVYVNTLPIDNTSPLGSLTITGVAGLTVSGNVTTNTAPNNVNANFFGLELDSTAGNVTVNGHLTTNNTLQFNTGQPNSNGNTNVAAGNFVLGPNGRLTAPVINIDSVLDVAGSGSAVVDGAGATININIQNAATLTQSGNLLFVNTLPIDQTSPLQGGTISSVAGLNIPSNLNINNGTGSNSQEFDLFSNGALNINGTLTSTNNIVIKVQSLVVGPSALIQVQNVQVILTDTVNPATLTVSGNNLVFNSLPIELSLSNTNNVTVSAPTINVAPNLILPGPFGGITIGQTYPVFTAGVFTGWTMDNVQVPGDITGNGLNFGGNATVTGNVNTGGLGLGTLTVGGTVNANFIYWQGGNSNQNFGQGPENGAGVASPASLTAPVVGAPSGLSFSGRNEGSGSNNNAFPDDGHVLTLNTPTVLFDTSSAGPFIGPATFDGGDALASGSNPGGNGGTFNVNATGDITVNPTTAATAISASTGANATSVPSGGNGGTVNLNTTNGAVTVNATVQVSSNDVPNRKVSKQGGNITLQTGKTSGTGIQVTNSGQLLSLLNATAPGPGGTVQLISAGADINVDGKIQADRGMIDIHNNGASGNVNITSNAQLSADVIKAGALGPNGQLTISAGSQINANTLLHLYGGTGASGLVLFTGAGTVNISGSQIHIAGTTVQINSSTSVNNTGSTFVHATNHNYGTAGFGNFVNPVTKTPLSGAPAY